MAKVLGLRCGVVGLAALLLAACAAPAPNGGAIARPKASTAPIPDAPGLIKASAAPLPGGIASAVPGQTSLLFPLRLTPQLPAALIGNDGAALLANDGSSLIANDGAALLANDGAGLIANDGSGLIGNDGAGLIANDGAGVVAAGAGHFRLAQAEEGASPAWVLGSARGKIWEQGAISYAMDQMMWAWAQAKPRLGNWTRFSARIQVLPIPLPEGIASDSGVGKAIQDRLLGKEDHHFAAYWRESASGMVVTGVLLPKADAPASEGLPVCELRSNAAGEAQIRLKHLERLGDNWKVLGLEGVSLWSRFQFLPGKQHRVELVMAREAGSLQGPLAMMPLLQNAKVWGHSTYDVAGDGALRMRFSAQILQKPFTHTSLQGSFPVPRTALRNLIAADSSSLGLAAWMRFSSNEDFSSSFNQASVPAVQVFGSLNGGLSLNPSEALRARMPDGALASDQAFHLPIPGDDEAIVDDARFDIQPLSVADFQATGGLGVK